MALPGGEPRRRVGAEDENSSAPGWSAAQLGEGVGGVAGPAAVELEIADLEPGDAPDGRRHHRQPVLGRADVRGSDLLPRHVRHHEEDDVEAERVAGVDSRRPGGRRAADRRFRRTRRSAGGSAAIGPTSDASVTSVTLPARSGRSRFEITWMEPGVTSSSLGQPLGMRHRVELLESAS